jgi:hypothetical protein
MSHVTSVLSLLGDYRQPSQGLTIAQIVQRTGLHRMVVRKVLIELRHRSRALPRQIMNRATGEVEEYWYLGWNANCKREIRRSA